LEVGEEALLVLEVKEAPDTWHYHCFSEMVSADPDCMVAQEGESLPGFDSPVVSQIQAANRQCYYDSQWKYL
jgi:hypothetical protein